jgi:hypothetical protein
LIKYGYILAFNSTNGGFINKAERFFTRSKFNHVSVTIPPVLGIDCHLSAILTVTTEPVYVFMNDESEQYKSYYPIGFTDKQIEQATTRMFSEFAGKTYGFFQLLWFVYRYFAEGWPFYADVRKNYNWFPHGPICSEVVWYYLYWLACSNPNALKLKNKLEEWKPDNFSPADCINIMEEYDNLFTLSYTRWDD